VDSNHEPSSLQLEKPGVISQTIALGNLDKSLPLLRLAAIEQNRIVLELLSGSSFKGSHQVIDGKRPLI